MSQAITVAAYPEGGVGNDPKPLGVAFLQGPPFTLIDGWMNGLKSDLHLLLLNKHKKFEDDAIARFC